MKAVKSIFHFCIASLIVILFFELYFSFAGILSPIVKIDPVKGERYYSNKLCNSLFISEGFGLARTNSEGWFGKEFQDKGNSDISIAIIGNSFVAARQVFYRNNFISIADREINLNEEDLNISIYSFGKESMPLRELLNIKEEIVNEHDLDYVVVLINEMSFANAKRFVPYYELIEDSLILNRSFENSPMVKLYNKLHLIAESSLLFLGFKVKNNLKKTPEILLDKFYREKIISSSSSRSVKSIELLNRKILEKLDKDKRVVFLTNIDSDRFNEVKSIINNSPIIDLSIMLTKMKNKLHTNPYYWKINRKMGHWNNNAHKVIGKELADNLFNIIMKDRKSSK